MAGAEAVEEEGVAEGLRRRCFCRRSDGGGGGGGSGGE